MRNKASFSNWNFSPDVKVREAKEMGFSLPSGSICEITAPISYAEASAARVIGTFG